MATPSLRLMSHDDLPPVLSLLAASGSTARTADSWQYDRMTALLLGEPRNPQAVMPLARRTIPIAPGRTLAAGWLSSNQFTSRMSLRRQTRATAADWSTLLPDLDALLVMRRDEASLAARWYAQTGFHDVLSIRCLYLDMESAPGGQAPARTGRGYQVHVVTPPTSPPTSPAENTAWTSQPWQAQMAAVYHEVYASCGGARPRDPAFWTPALAHHYYHDHYQFQVIGLWNAAPASPDAILMGYAIVGWSGWHSKRPRMDILELATRQWDAAIAGDLIQTTCQLAWSKNVRQVRAVISVHDPYRGHLARTGFIDRWGYLLLAKWLNSQRYLDRLTLPAELGDFSLLLSSAGQVPLTLRSGNAGKSAGKSGGGSGEGGGESSAPTAAPLHLQADQRAITRFLLNRLDISSALQDGTLFTPLKPTDADTARLAMAFPWTPWVFHMLDYI